MSHWNVPVQTTSSFVLGVEVPIPICPPESTVIFAASFGPIWSDPTVEFVRFVPMAVAPLVLTVFPLPIAIAEYPATLLLYQIAVVAASDPVLENQMRRRYGIPPLVALFHSPTAITLKILDSKAFPLPIAIEFSL